MSHFINDRARLVQEAIDAEVALAGGPLRRLDGYPAIKVVVRADHDPTRVAVVSGGGAGHEPAHLGFVGDGMLSAAVCGEVFASPSVDAVLAGILAVTGPAGCLLVIKNYTGDRLNFGLAAEKARALGLAVATVIVGDDIALPGAPRPRGVAGTLLVHKVAGHLARAGAPLAQVHAAAERVARSVATIGAALSSCTIPGQPAENRVPPGQVELGLGIHGEPGARLLPLPPARALVATMSDLLGAALGPGDAPLALLINDLGGVPPIEMALVAHAAVAAAPRPVRLVLGPARLMTSLDMKGFSLSAIPLDDPDLEAALASPVGPRAWPAPRRPAADPPLPLPLPAALAPPDRAASPHPARRRALARLCAALIDRQAELDALDARAGDGDTGTTLATAARALAADLDALPLAHPPALLAALSERLARAMGGSSGILLAIFCAAAGARVGDPPDWPAALAEGVRRVQEHGGAAPGDRTMLDALAPAIAALAAGQGLAAAAREAAAGADRTAQILETTAGRASYVRSEALRGVPDPGAVAVAAAFAALADA